MPEITAEDAFECTSLVYRKWAEAFDNLKRVKAEKPNPKVEPDWEQFHAIRLKNAIADEAKWKAFLTRMTAICPRLT